MSRQKISEFSAKTLLYKALGLTYLGYPITSQTTTKQLRAHFGNQNLVLKLDQGIKKRGKLGFVKLNLTPGDIPTIASAWIKQGWTNFLAEPMIEHGQSSEQYLALEQTRHGWKIMYSPLGGIEVESSWDQISSDLPPKLKNIVNSSLIPALEKYHLTFIEMNPIIFRNDQLIPLDMAVEIDSAALALPFISDLNITLPTPKLSLPSEQAVNQLDSATPASLKLKVINQQGKIWMLLSGGGASLVLADEVADIGLGGELANYGEYSGAPNEDDTYSYTKIILTQMLSTKRAAGSKLALIIAGGVANFTDVKKTFKGIIRAMDEKKQELSSSGLKVFVRRGGPNEKAGLKLMSEFLQQSDLLGSVRGHSDPLVSVIKDAKNYLKTKS